MNADRRKARALLASAAAKLSRNPEDQTVASDVDRRRATYRCLVLAEHIRDEIPQGDDIDAWAERIADALTPLSPTEAAAVGRLAAALDSRRRTAAAAHPSRGDGGQRAA